MVGKMRVLITTFGSLGDLYPYIAIALEMKRRDLDPVIGSIPVHRPLVEQAGLEFRPVRTAVLNETDSALMRKLFHPRKGIQMLIRDLVMQSLEVAYEDTMAAAEGASMIVAHPLTFASRAGGRVLKIPWVTTQLAPMAFLSVYDPPVFPADPYLHKLAMFGPAFFGFIKRVGQRMMRSWTAPYVRFSARLGLPVSADPMFGEHSPYLELALFSELLGRKQPDWPPQAVTTGFCIYDGAESTLAAEIAAFLRAGDAPIVFTLGSSAVFDAGRFYEESAQAARLLGRRAILLTGSDPANRPAHLPADVVAFDYAPYGLLFPHVAAIVHQGGVGTTAQAMRSGRPMLVMPFAFDQHDNAARMSKLGIARVIKKANYSARNAARELAKLLSDDNVSRRAKQVGEDISSENGARVACDRLMALFG